MEPNKGKLDQLSKEALTLKNGSFISQEDYDGQVIEETVFLFTLYGVIRLLFLLEFSHSLYSVLVSFCAYEGN